MFKVGHNEGSGFSVRHRICLISWERDALGLVGGNGDPGCCSFRRASN